MYVRSLPLSSATGLVDHHPGIWQTIPLALSTGGQQEGPHATGLTNTHCADVWLDKLHSVVNRHSRRYGSSRRVDIKMNIFIGIFRLQEQELLHYQVRHVIFNRPNQENNPLLQQARINIVRALTARRLLYNDGHQAAVNDGWS